jgi:hypothetical protein
MQYPYRPISLYTLKKKNAIYDRDGYNNRMSDDLEFFFPELNPANPENIPVAPAEMRFIEVKVEPVLDNGPLRLRVYVETSAFLERPYLEVTLFNSQGDEIASASVIEPMQRKNVFTMHVRGQQQSGKFSLMARLFYPEKPDSDSREIKFEI